MRQIGQPMRQGDVLLVPVAAPADMSKLKEEEGKGDIVLALGEVTGHRHRIPRKKGVRSFRMESNVRGQFDRLVQVEGRANRQLIHEEHATVEIAPGWYNVIIQSEYDEEAVRAVED